MKKLELITSVEQYDKVYHGKKKEFNRVDIEIYVGNGRLTKTNENEYEMNLPSGLVFYADVDKLEVTTAITSKENFDNIEKSGIPENCVKFFYTRGKNTSATLVKKILEV